MRPQVVKQIRPEVSAKLFDDYSNVAFEPGHSSVVFQTREQARTHDLNGVFGRYNPRENIVYLINDAGAGKKYAALMDAGYRFRIAKEGQNYYDCTYELPAGGLSEQVTEATDTEEGTDIVFTAPGLGVHMVGTLYSDGFELAEELDVLGIEELETDEDGYVVHTSLTADQLVGLIRYVRQYEPLSESSKLDTMYDIAVQLHEQGYESAAEEQVTEEKVQFNALAGVKQLLSSIALHQRNGDHSEAKKLAAELRAELETYKKATPPADGIKEVEKELELLFSEKNIVESLLGLSASTTMVTDADLIRGALR